MSKQKLALFVLMSFLSFALFSNPLVSDDEYVWQQLCDFPQSYPNSTDLFICKDKHVGNDGYALLKGFSWASIIGGTISAFGALAAVSGHFNDVPLGTGLAGGVAIVGGVVGPSAFIDGHAYDRDAIEYSYRLERPSGEEKEEVGRKQLIRKKIFDTVEGAYETKTTKNVVVAGAATQMTASILTVLIWVCNLSVSPSDYYNGVYAILFSAITAGGLTVLIDDWVN